MSEPTPTLDSALPPAPARRRALVFVNAKASQTSGTFERIEAALTAGGFRVTKAEATCGDYTDLVREHLSTTDLVIAAGGDGTVCCAAEAIMTVTDGKMPLGVVPLGTANNVARSLRLPLNVEGACGVIVAGHIEPMDLGRVNGRLFVSVAGLGLSTQVHDQVPAEQKRKWGSLAYAAQAIRLLLGKTPGFRAEIRLPGGVQRVKALQITVCNGRYYGAHLEVHAEASLSDGMLDVSIIETQSYVKGFFKALLPLRTGHRSAGLRLIQTPSVEIRTKRPMKLDVEGSTDLQTPASFEVIPQALRVFSPAAAA